MLQRDEEILLARQRHEFQPARPRRRLDAEAGVGAAAGHRFGSRAVRGLGALEAADALRRDLLLRQQFLQHHARAGAARAVREAQARSAQVGQRLDAQRVARRHHQPLRAPREAHQLVVARLEHRPVDLRGGRAQRRLGQRMEAGHQAAAVVQRGQRIDAAAELDVQVQLVLRLRQRAQQGQRVVVAGRHRDHAGAGVEGDREGLLQLAAQRLDLRRQPRLRAPLGPQQLLAEGRQQRRLAFHPDHQRLAELAFPALELAPDVAVRQLELSRGAADRAGVVHRGQQRHQRVVKVALRRLAAGQRVGEAHPMHVGSYGRGCLWAWTIHASMREVG